MDSRNIQCVAHGLVLKGSKILAYKVEDKVEKRSFYRLIGGHIDFGESASDALKREFKEEIDEEIQIVKKLDVFENIFTYKGKSQHEFVSLFEIKFLSEKPYSKNVIIGHEGPHRTFKAKWIDFRDFDGIQKVFYPPEILSHLSK